MFTLSCQHIIENMFHTWETLPIVIEYDYHNLSVHEDISMFVQTNNTNMSFDRIEKQETVTFLHRNLIAKTNASFIRNDFYGGFVGMQLM